MTTRGEILLLAVAWVAAISYGAASELAPTAQTAEVRWRYTLETPSPDWLKPGFDDSNWREGQGGFGTAGTPSAIVGTEWNSSNIWLRREFILPDKKLTNPRLILHFDEAPEIYLNGVLAAKMTGWSTCYDEADISPAALATLKPGKNLMAVQASQTYGGQYIDVGIVEAAGPLPVRQLFDFPVRDTSICVGPDNAYYLTGTTGESTGGPEDRDGWWYVNRGIRVWRSTNLTNWTLLGRVWTFEKNATWQKARTDEKGVTRRAIWAPEIHYLKGTFWLAYCVNYQGTGLLRSTTGKAEGPYVDVRPEGPITDEIDASLFEDDDGKVYFVFQNGKIARLKDDLTGLAETPRLLKPANAPHVGFEGAFLTKIGGRYQLVCAEFNRRLGTSTYDCMVASSENVYGPYGNRYLAIAHAGHNMFFRDIQGRWWATFFGNDPRAPWRERPGLLPIEWGPDGKVQVGEPPVEAVQPGREDTPALRELPLRRLFDTPLRDTSICRGPNDTYYLTGTVQPFWAYNEGIHLWRSKDLAAWEPLGQVWKYGASAWHTPYLKAKKPLWAPEVRYLKGTFWLTYSLPGWDGTGKTSGCGLLKSQTGKPEGPYEDVQPNERMGDEIDASLFEDDDGTVYFLWHSGKIARMKADLSGLAEPYRWLKSTVSDPNPKHHSGLCAGIFGRNSFDHIGYEGMFLFKANGLYHLCCAENFEGRYSCAIATATNLFGPYSARYEALRHAGHNVFFHDNDGNWWSTYFGSDNQAPWRERPGIFPVRFGPDGRVEPARLKPE